MAKMDNVMMHASQDDIASYEHVVVDVKTEHPLLTSLPLPEDLTPDRDTPFSTVIVTADPLTRKQILVAWTVLLQRITDAEELGFAVDDGVMVVNCANGTSQTKSAEVEDVKDFSYTGVFFEREPPKNCLVYLRTQDDGLFLGAPSNLVISPTGNQFLFGIRYFLSSGGTLFPNEQPPNDSETPEAGKDIDEVLPSDPTVEALLRNVESATAAHEALLSDIESILSCTPAQEGMLADSHFASGNSYMYHLYLRLPSDVDLPRLKEAFQQVYDHRHIFRTGFWQLDDINRPFAMAVYKKGSMELPWSETTVEQNEDETEPPWESFATSEIGRDNLHLPPWRVNIIKNARKEEPEIVISIHHALFDGFSMWLLLEDVQDVYRGRSLLARNSFLAVLNCINERSREHPTDGKRAQQSKEYWTSFLTEPTGTSEGTWNTPFPSLLSYKVPDESAQNVHSVMFTSRRKYSDIHNRCVELGYKIQALGQAAWARVLSAYTGDVGGNIGLVLSGRSEFPEAQGIVFPCVTTLPYVYNLESSTGLVTNRQLLHSILKSNKEMLPHQHSSLRNIIKWTKGASAFDTVFVFQKVPSRQKEFWDMVDYKTSINYKVTVELFPMHGDELLIRGTCLDSVMNSEQTDILIHQWEESILDMLDHPDSPAADISNRNFMPAQLLSIRPAPTPELSAPVRFMHKFVEMNALALPNKPALEFNFDYSTKNALRWTYSQLNSESNRLANQLISKVSLKADDIVAVTFDKCPEATIAILAVLKTGAAFMAVDPAAPAERKAFILKDSGAKLVLCTADTSSGLQGAADVPLIQVDLASLARYPATPIALPHAKPTDLCYGLYTSGSTGTPKLCLITHENGVQAMMAFQELFKGHWTANSRFLQFASYHFDVSVLEQFWSWSVGICVVSAPRDLILSNLMETIQRLHITHLDLTPSLGRLLDPSELPSLQKGVYITGGEALSSEILEKWGEYGCLYNGYGPTEVTIGCTMFARMARNDKPSNIGPAFANVHSMVLRPNTRLPVLRGGIGELSVGGKLVGRGYLNRDELTAEKFFFDEDTASMMYRTGDLVRMLADGSLDFLGRIDHQVKLRGQRLEVDEITELLKKNVRGLTEVVTTVAKHPKNQREQLITFYCCTYPVSANELQGICRQYLPPYMVPSRFIALNAMPLSRTNKVDLHELKKIYSSDVEASLGTKVDETVVHSPWTPTQLELRSLIAEFASLDPDTITQRTSLFEIGLDSVSTIALAKKMRQKGYHGATPARLMKYPSILSLETAFAEIDRTYSDGLSPLQSSMDRWENEAKEFGIRHARTAEKQLGLPSTEIEGIFPCTPLQEGMCTAFAASGGQLYFNSTILTLRNEVDISVMREAWSQIVQEISILRTCFVQTDEGYAQVVLRNWKPTWEVLYDEVNVVEERTQAYLRSNSSLQRPPIYFLCLFSREGIKLNISLFHAIYDARSSAILLGRVQQRYDALLKSPDSIQKILGDGSSDFHDYLKYIMVEQTGSDQYWSRLLANIPTAASPPRQKRQNEEDFEIRSNFHQSRLTEMARDRQCTVQSLVQAAWAVSLATILGMRFCIGVVTSGRMLPVDGIEDVIGPMFNTLACPVDVRGSRSLAELVHCFHRYNQDVLPYQHTPLRKIQKMTGKKSLFETLFVFHTDEFTRTGQHHESLWTEAKDNSRLDMSLAFDAKLHSDDTISLLLKGNPYRVTVENLQTLADHFEYVLKCIVNKPEMNPVELRNTLGETKLSAPMRKSTLFVRIPKNDPNTLPDSAVSCSGLESKTLRELVSAICNVNEDMIDDEMSFFELGFDSVDAVRLSASARSRGFELSVAQIMDTPNIRALAAHASNNDTVDFGENNRFDEFAVAVKAILDPKLCEDITDIYPATPLQEGMILGWKATEGSQYLNHHMVKLSPSIDLRALRISWEEIIKSNDILRTSFRLISKLGTEYSFAQIVHRYGSIPTSWVEVQLSDGEDILDAATRHKWNAKVGIDMLSAPPLRITVLQSESESYMMISIGHVLYDGWSLGLLQSDLRRALCGEVMSPRPSPKSIIGNLLIDSAKGQTGSEFWKAEFEDFHPAPLPQALSWQEDSPQMASKMITGASRIAPAEARRFASSIGVTLHTVGMVAWAMCLGRISRTDDVAFGVVLAGRHTPTLQNSMFPTFNTLPVRVILEGSHKDILLHVQSKSSTYLSLQQYPLKKIQKDSGVAHPLVDTVFVYQDLLSDEGGSETLSEAENDVASLIQSEAAYPLSVELQPHNGEFVWRLGFRQNIMHETEAQILLRDLDHAFMKLLKSPDTPLTSLAISPPPIYDSALGSQESVPLKQSVVNEDTRSTILSVVSDISGVPIAAIGEQNLLQLGLDSISAIELSSALRGKGVDLKVGDILRAQTVGKMVEMCALPAVLPAPARSTEKTETVPYMHSMMRINTATIEAVLPATAGQALLLSLWQQSGGQIFMPIFPFSTGAKLDLGQLQWAFTRLVERNAALRTIFMPTWMAKNPVAQVVLRSVKVSITHEIRARNESDAILYAAAKTKLNKKIDPSSHLVALHVIDTPAKTTLFLQIHHALYDAVSLPYLLQEFMMLYGMEDDQAMPAPPSMNSLSCLVDTITGESDRQFWVQTLKDFKFTPSRAVSRKTTKGQFRAPPNAISTSALEKYCRSNAISSQALYLAAYAKAHAALLPTSKSSQHRNGIVLGLYHSNRHLPNPDPRLAFPTLNIVPLPVLRPTTRPLLEIAADITQFLIDISNNGRTTSGLWEIQSWTGVQIDCFVNLLKLPKSTSEPAGIPNLQLVPIVDQEPVPAEVAITSVGGCIFENLDVSLDAEISVTDDGMLSLGLVYSDAIEPALVAERFYAHVQDAARGYEMKPVRSEVEIEEKEVKEEKWDIRIYRMMSKWLC